MKPFIALFLILIGLSLTATSSSLAQKNIQADTRLFVYETPDQQPYVEFYLAVLSASIHRPLTGGNSGVTVTLHATHDGDITYANKYALTKSTDSEQDFYDVQRISIDRGLYKFHVKIVDMSDTTRWITRELEIDVQANPEKITLSSIQLLGNATAAESEHPLAKNGLIMEPLKYNFLNVNYDRLLAYVEAYRVNDFIEGKYLLRYDLIHQASGGPDTVLTRYKRRTANTIDPILIQETNDTSWSSGKYELAISLLDDDQNLLATAIENFIISNPKKSIKSQFTQETIDNSFVQALEEEDLTYAIRALAPKVNPLDVERLNQLVANGDIASKRSFLYRFWLYSNSLDPEGGFNHYMKVVKALDNLFYDGLGRGFETDRGYYYLKYGEPDHIVSVEDEPTAPPYQIWTYTEFPATRQNNVKFVFYNPAGTTYNLLHSNARGELNDPQWLVKLYKNSREDVIGNSIDATGVKDYWNRRAAEYYNDN